MTRIALRGLLARKLRFFLTALAVLLGTTLIAGTYIFTDSINSGFDKIFTASNKGTDASVTAKKTFENSDGTQPVVPASVLEQVRKAPDVETAGGTVFDLATILDKKGKRTGSGGAPSFIGSVAPEARFNAVTYPQGRGPRTDDEAAVDNGTAKKAGFKVGDRICAVAAQPRKCFKLVGVTEIAGVGFGGASTLELTLHAAQRMLDKKGFDQIQAASKPGVSPQKLSDELRASLPASVQVRTGQQEAAKQSADIRDNLGFLKIALLAFAGISLFVGAFLIFNTFSITVAQRSREIALLRTLGASRKQVLRSVILEGLLVGIVGGFLGVALGLGTAAGLKELFKAFGADLPSGGSVLATRTIVLTVAVGAVVSVVSSIAPAIRATRVAPIEALTESAAPVTKAASRRLTISALALLALGVALMCLGLFASLSTNGALSAVGAGAALTFIGVALVSPHLVRPLASAIGGPIERFTGITGRLARENSVRQSGRTAVTAAALMIGVALVTFASIFAAGAKTTIAKAVDQNLRGELVVQASGGNQPFAPGLLQQAARTDGVAAASGVRFSKAKLPGGKTVQVASIEPPTFTKLYDLKLKTGSLGDVRALGDGQALMSKKYAEGNDLDVGATVRATTPSGKRVPLKVTAITDDNGFLSTDLVVSEPVMRRDFGETKDAVGFIGLRPGADAKAVKKQLTALVDREYPGSEVLTDKEFKDSVAGQVDQLLTLIYALLALAIIVSLFGIVNTLVLSVTERTRELGMLRAIGTSRKQVKRMIRWEAVITALIGSILGAVVGVILAVLFTRPLDDFTLSIPIGTLVAVLILGGVAGVFAAILPARRASRLNVLDALAYE
ncbi:MAG: FtsX-like permease family protein [Solirubrobacteraceae bacterium]